MGAPLEEEACSSHALSDPAGALAEHLFAVFCELHRAQEVLDPIAGPRLADRGELGAPRRGGRRVRDSRWRSRASRRRRALALISDLNRATDGTVVVPSEYVEVVIERR